MKNKYIPPLSWPIFTPIYDFSCLIFGFGKRFREKILKSVQLDDNTVVLDVGCGTGMFLKIAKETYPKARFIGVDPDKKSLEIAKKRFARFKLPIEIKEAGAQSLPLASDSVDICFSTLAFHHMPNEVKQKAVKEIYRVLKPGGIMVICDFWESKGLLFNLMHIFKKIEHMEGNINGLVSQYVKDAGFSGYDIVGSHFPGIKIIKAKKI